uniref:Uncharacterized protein n=1 Tax=Helianthus annuus TaxID=4232 RepID=A0A251RRW4_HELAN
MDFHSLNRRQLQSLCKLNQIPANITNVAMADALKSLQTVTYSFKSSYFSDFNMFSCISSTCWDNNHNILIRSVLISICYVN